MGFGVRWAATVGAVGFLLLSSLSLSGSALASGPATPIHLTGSEETRDSHAKVAQSPVPKWTDLTSSYPGPPAKRAYGDMAYDAALGYDVLFGGENGAAVDGDTWNFTLAHGWNEISTSSSVAARADAAIAYDSSASEVVLYGGCEGLTNCPAGDTWAFSGGSWAQNTAGASPTGTLSASMSDDPADGGLLMFGGCSSFAVLSSTCNTYIASTYTFTATGGWSVVSSSQNPSARDSSGMAYDPVDGYVLMFGGYTGTHTLSDTWTFKGGQWTNITSTLAQSPPARSAGAMFWDASTQQVILYGGDGVSNDIGDTWAFSGGQWTRLYASTGPSPRDGVMWGAPTSSGLPILFGGQSNGTYFADTWDFGVPLTASGTASPTAVDVGQSVSFTSLPSGGEAPYRYAWAFGDGATSSVENTSHTYSTSQTTPYLATVTITDALGSSTTKTLSINVTAVPQVAAAASPVSSLVGQSISFWANVTGGALPLTYAWTLGDTTGSTLPDPTHSYSGAGNYSARVVITDATGVTSVASVNVSVTAPPGSLSVTFTANPVSGPIPLTVLFNPKVSGGAAPYTYVWNFGDGGASSTATAPSHTYNQSGAFLALVNVSDSAGHGSTYRQSITVNPSPLSATATASPAGGLAPLTVSFQGPVVGGQPPYSFTWTFGDGAPVSHAPSPTHTFNSSSVYNVTLRVADAPSDGRSTSAWVLVNVTAVAPLAVTVGIPACVVAGTSATFNATFTGGTPPVSLVWDFGDHSPPVHTNDTSENHTYANASAFDLNVSIADSGGHTAWTLATVNVVSSAGCSSSPGGTTGSSATMGSRDWLIYLGPEVLLAAIVIGTLVGFRGRREPGLPPG